MANGSPSTDDRAPKSETRKWGIFLTWQNAAIIASFIISACTVYFKLDQRMQDVEGRISRQDKIIQHQEDWLGDIGFKDGVKAPEWRN